MRASELTDGQVCRLRRCELTVIDGCWSYANERATAIAAHWQRRLAENPKMFNGCIHVLCRHSVQDGVLRGAYAKTDFASYLYWRENGFNDPPTCDGFASVLLCGRNGQYLVARAANRTLNAGYDVPPGGMIDERDVDQNGRIDVARYALRELFEETGLRAEEVVLDGETWVARDGALLAIGVVCRSTLSDQDLIARVNAHSAADRDAELSGARWFDPNTSSDVRVPRYVELLSDARGGLSDGLA